jgi:purine-binding chemotaxis protein CheW
MAADIAVELGGSDELQLVVFQLANEEFGVDIKQVREIIKLAEITTMPNSPPFVEGVINLRGQITTIMDLRKRLNLDISEENENTRIIILDINKETIGMIVDSVTEVLRLPYSEVDPTPSLSTEVDAEYIMGVGKLETSGQARLLILLDLTKVLTKQELEQVIDSRVKSSG